MACMDRADLSRMAGVRRGEEDIRVQQVGIRLAGVCDRTSRCDLLGLRGLQKRIIFRCGSERFVGFLEEREWIVWIFIQRFRD